MSSLKWVASLISLVLLIFVCEAEQKLSTKECENLGFTGLALCSDCHTFAEYIKDQGEFYFYFQSIRLDFDEILFLYGFNFCVEWLFCVSLWTLSRNRDYIKISWILLSCQIRSMSAICLFSYKQAIFDHVLGSQIASYFGLYWTHRSALTVNQTQCDGGNGLLLKIYGIVIWFLWTLKKDKLWLSWFCWYPSLSTLVISPS